MSEWDYWTELDEAELDVIIWEIVQGALAHKKHCETCRTTDHACQGFATAVNEMRDWIFGRQLLSRMEALRNSEKSAASTVKYVQAEGDN